MNFFVCYECEKSCVNDTKYFCERCSRAVCKRCCESYQIMSEKDLCYEYAYCCCKYCLKERPVKVITFELDKKQYTPVVVQRATMLFWKERLQALKDSLET
jgi:hypothetical protein